ncbi:protein artemis-like [Mizuhopecten yessoensis]|uniref:Protein artemis n=1 Tax=Mizuhopecten yessoensis TaxID=6573 RepID=A0A210PYP1_MIZYE|nr:protein artemis-like [Mizuhopecten yessoensis]OWF41607.1 Protein artemis [Mizuhopecten yessoensis]
MSCFKGRMSEYRNISLDRFDGQNLNSTVYFLSHLHEDHTVGLSVSSFITRLKESSEVYLYCSDVTKVLLIESPKYQHLERYIKTLPINQPVTVSIPQASSCKVDMVQVTLLPAAHCPGSVMFLFEGSEGTALYTGDFRWEANHISQVTALHNGDSVKPIQSLYVDTTFCHPDCFHIPSRQDCVEAVSGLVKEWIAKGQGHVVHFTPRSQYGHEHLLKEISTRTQLKVHVSKSKVRIYEQISDLKGIFTSDPDETPIHACLGEMFARGDRDSLPCGYQPPKHSKFNKMVILPSTMYFTKKMRLNLANIVERTHGIYRACYSFHSSYSEVRSLVTYLRPGKVRPNVKPPPDSSLGEVQKRLNHFLKLEHDEQKYETVNKTFGTLKKRKFRKRKLSRLGSSDSDDLVFGSPDLKRIRSVEGNITPVKNQRGTGPEGDREGVNVPPMSPQEAVTPMKSEISDVHSSYAGSNHDDSEMSDTGLLCESSDDQQENSGFKGDDLSTPPQSLLDAIDSQSSSQEVNSFRVTFLEDEEQTVGQQAWESPDIPDFGEETTNSKTQIREESMLTDRDSEEKSEVVNKDSIGDKSSQKVDNSVTNGREANTTANSCESLKLQGYQGDVDSSLEETDSSQKFLKKDVSDFETSGNDHHSMETSNDAKEDKENLDKDVEVSVIESLTMSYSDDELLEQTSNKHLNSESELNHKDKSSSECSRNEIVDISQNCNENSRTVSSSIKQQPKDTDSTHSKDLKKNGSYDLFEESNDGFCVGEMEGECQIVSVTSIQGPSETDRKVDSEGKKSDSFDCESSEIKLLKDKQENQIDTGVQVCEGNQTDTKKQKLSQEMSEKSEGFEVTDLTENYDEQSYISDKGKQDVQLVPTSHACQTTNEKIVSDKKHPSMSRKGVHRLSSCDTPGTSRSVCQCVLDANPQPETILVEIQEDNVGEQGVKQKRQQNKRSPQKPSSKLLTNTQTNNIVIAILDSDSESDEQEPCGHKGDVTNVHGNESDSDMTLPPSQEVNKVTKKAREMFDSTDGKDEDVMIIDDDDDTEDDSDDSTSVSSSNSDESLKKICPRSRLDKIQQALYKRNNEKMPEDITMYLANNTADSDSLQSDDSDCAVIDLTQSDSEEDSKEEEISHSISHPKEES